MIRRPYKSSRNRRGLLVHQLPDSAQIVAAVTLSTDVPKQALITTNIPVIVSALPVGITSLGAAPTAFTQLTPTTFKLAFAVAPAAAGAWAINANVTQVRATNGGRLATANGVF